MEKQVFPTAILIYTEMQLAGRILFFQVAFPPEAEDCPLHAFDNSLCFSLFFSLCFSFCFSFYPTVLLQILNCLAHVPLSFIYL